MIEIATYWFSDTSFGKRGRAVLKLVRPNEPEDFFASAPNENAPETDELDGKSVKQAINSWRGAFMSYKYHIGVDYHKKYSYLVVKDDQGKVLRSGQVPNQKKTLAKFVEPFATGGHAVLEATRNWVVMHDWLEELLDEVVLANPLKVKAIAEAKIKTDKIDSNVLSDLLRVDMIPKAHVPSRRARDMRVSLRERMFFVRLRTMVKNRIHTIFDKYPEEAKKFKMQTDLFGKSGRAILEKIPVSEIDRILIDRELSLLDDLGRVIKEAEETIKLQSKGNENVTRLKTIPGIGEFFARLIDAEIDDISRFRNPKKLAGYAGLVPSTYSSGGKTFNGRIIKGGNKWLRWAFVEAVIPAISNDDELKDLYEQIKAKKGYNKAKVTVARRLLTIAFHVLKEKRNYRPLNKHEREMKKLLRSS
jgi:transposase